MSHHLLILQPNLRLETLMLTGRKWLAIVSVIAITIVSLPLLTSADTTAKTTSAEVFAQLTLAQAEIELIRFHLGKPRLTAEEIQASEAVPREVYFQAATQFTKANRLSFEQTRKVALPYQNHPRARSNPKMSSI